MFRALHGKVNRFAIDVLINIVGTGFPLFVLQILIYPTIAKMIEANLYGQMQSSLSIIYLIGGTLGGTLSTTRLIMNSDYSTKRHKGDYNILLLFNGIITIVVTLFVLTIFYKDAGNLENFLVTIVALLNFIQNYIDVGFRLNLDYQSIFICKVLTCIGYVFGFLVFLITLKWQYIFVVSYTLTIIYCAKKTRLLKENYTKTLLFKKTVGIFCNLSFATLMNKALTYFDKLILYPIMGGEAVSIYFAANIFGKLILQILEPITNVILSYLSKKGKVTYEVWKITIVSGGLFCVLMYVICLVISKPILFFFYPQWAADAVPLIPIATASLCISSFISIVYPLTLKTIDSKKQIIINGISLILYVAAVINLYKAYGLKGCCIALLISYIVRLILITFFCVNKNERQ